MRHRNAGRQFSRNTSHRKAMFRALTANLVAHERIETTDAKAKELKRVAERLITHGGASPRLQVVPLGLSYPFRKLPREEAQARLRGTQELKAEQPFVMHVGSNLRRKNREGRG